VRWRQFCLSRSNAPTGTLILASLLAFLIIGYLLLTTMKRRCSRLLSSVCS